MSERQGDVESGRPFSPTRPVAHSPARRNVVSILAVGSVAFDSIKTPFGERERILGGSATYFSVAASFFTNVRVVAVVGDDFGTVKEAVFLAREIVITALENVPGHIFVVTY